MQPRPTAPEPHDPSQRPLDVDADSAQLPDSVRIARQARAGDERALDELFARYYERVDRIVRIRLGARARGGADASELAAHARREASLEIRSLDLADHAAVIQWLAGIAERRILAGLPAPKAPAPGMFTDESRAAGLALAVPARSFANPELKELYDACVESLPGRRRELILLREYAHCSWSQIVAEMGFASALQAQDEYRHAQLEMAGLMRHKLRG